MERGAEVATTSSACKKEEFGMQLGHANVLWLQDWLTCQRGNGVEEREGGGEIESEAGDELKLKQAWGFFRFSYSYEMQQFA